GSSVDVTEEAPHFVLVRHEGRATISVGHVVILIVEVPKSVARREDVLSAAGAWIANSRFGLHGHEQYVDLREELFALHFREAGELLLGRELSFDLLSSVIRSMIGSPPSSVQ